MTTKEKTYEVGQRVAIKGVGSNGFGIVKMIVPEDATCERMYVLDEVSRYGKQLIGRGRHIVFANEIERI